MALLTISGDSGEESFILSKSALIPVETSDAVFSGKRDDLVMLSGAYYAVSDGQLTSISEEEASPYFKPANLPVYEISENGDASVVIQTN